MSLAYSINRLFERPKQKPKVGRRYGRYPFRSFFAKRNREQHRGYFPMQPSIIDLGRSPSRSSKTDFGTEGCRFDSCRVRLPLDLPHPPWQTTVGRRVGLCGHSFLNRCHHAVAPLVEFRVDRPQLRRALEMLDRLANPLFEGRRGYKIGDQRLDLQ